VSQGQKEVSLKNVEVRGSHEKKRQDGNLSELKKNIVKKKMIKGVLSFTSTGRRELVREDIGSRKTCRSQKKKEKKNPSRTSRQGGG